jgi:hypothetical protein
MARTWVLRTETKGTGAQMVPLERTTTRPTANEPVLVPRKPARRREPQAPQPPPPHRFRVVDVMTRQALIEDAGTSDAVEVLKGVRSIVDVDVYVWQPERDRWRRLTFGEQRAMWELAASGDPAAVAEQ